MAMDIDLKPPETKNNNFSLKPNGHSPTKRLGLDEITELKGQLLEDIGQPDLDADNCEC